MDSVWLWQGLGIAALVAPVALLLLRRVTLSRSLVLMVGVFQAGSGALTISWGARHCSSLTAGGSIGPDGSTYSYTVCLQWGSDPLVAVLGGVVLVGAVLALWTVAGRMSPGTRGLLLVGAGLLVLGGVYLTVSPVGLLIFLFSPLILWVVGTRELRRRSATPVAAL